MTTMTIKEHFEQINTQKLMQDCLATKGQIGLSSEQRIALLSDCIKLGEKPFTDVKFSYNKHLIVFFGNTGSGKSTLINYLAGCSMSIVPPSTIGEIGLENITIVDPKSPQPGIMPIGHSRISETFMPAIASSGANVFCDCPGFGDNRGAVINIANTANIHRVIEASESIRLVVLINFQSMLADKAKGLNETIATIRKIFRNLLRFNEHKNAILFGITKMPQIQSNEKQHSIDELKACLSNDPSITDPYDRAIVQRIKDNFFIYHPTDDGDQLRYEGAQTRQTILNRIDALTPIWNPGEAIDIVLTPDDAVALREIYQNLSERVIFSLRNEQHGDAVFLLELVRKMRVVNHKIVYDLIDNLKLKIIEHFKDVIQEIHRELANGGKQFPERAQDLFKIVCEGINSFDVEDISEIEQAIGISELRDQFEQHKQRIDCYQSQSRLRSQTKKFYDYCINKAFDEAEKLLKEIELNAGQLQSDFDQIGLGDIEIDLPGLHRLLAKFKDSNHKITQLIEGHQHPTSFIHLEVNPNINVINNSLNRSVKKLNYQEKKREQQDELKVKKNDNIDIEIVQLLDILSSLAPLGLGRLIGPGARLISKFLSNITKEEE